MATSTVLFTIILLFLGLSDSTLQVQSLSFGINYGQIANNLPSPSRVAVLLQSLNVSRVKLYDADPNVLQAFSNSDVDFIIGLGNDYLQSMSTDPLTAQSWIQQNVQPYLPQTKITCINVGNEVLGGNDTQLWSYLLPAMQSVYRALVNLGLSKQVAVTTAHSLTILGNSYPPSAGSFRQDLTQYIQPILSFHSQVNSPFSINAYPYFAYKASPSEVSLEYVLFQPNPGMDDSVTNLHYDNMLDAQIDAVYSAIKAMGYSDIEVRISETGWPSKGDANEAGATPENAGIYNGNLMRKIEENKGTPAMPKVPVDIYVFALFNEDLKPGPASERNYGLYYPDGTPVYDIGFQGSLLGVQGNPPGVQGLPQLTFSADSNVNAMSIFNFLILLIVYLLLCAY
ncbi:glucan endo-1,3-beta-glucosidase 14 [Pyrus x bretschneideri]|uniref:glucan endo-1,3-beta-glucosidase 14 n=1 Tax=Pyrus x bretschneideri TaxID=225117 RepID=UPI00202F7264|nr:glucan endo-1,3-beta-glucosidase 14 [Pyrus x bretschneideri]